jgi:inhibitor of cysteine peptidase
MLTLGEQDNGRHLPARVGDVIEVRLAENATTGYRWALDSRDPGVIEAMDAAANYPNAAVGSGGEAIFRFRVIGPGAATLALKSWRHWEGPESVVQRFAVTIDAAR